MFVLRVILGVVCVLLFWNGVVKLIPYFNLDPTFDVGDDYVIQYPGAYVFYGPSAEEHPPDRIVYPETTLEFALRDPWFLGRTEKGWFAINKKTHEVHYPCAAKSDLQEITALDISSVEFLTDPTPYVRVPDYIKKGLRIANFCSWILLFLVPSLLGFGPYIPKLVFKRKGVRAKLGRKTPS